MQRFFFMLCGLLVVTFLGAQQTIPSHVQQYGTENGMPSNGIKGLQFDDKTGFLWIATEAGIVRFNGVDFSTYTRENLPAIASERMMFITRSHNGRIYTADTWGNIFTVEESRPVVWWKPEKARNPFYDNYFLWSVSDGFFRKKISSSSNNMLSAISHRTVSLSDTACLVQSQDQVYYYSISMIKPEILFGADKYIAIFKIDSSVFLVAPDKQVVLFSPSSKTVALVTLKSESGEMFSFFNDNSKLYWEMGMECPVQIQDENAFVFSYRDRIITGRKMFTGIPADAFVKSVLYSKKNNQLFIGTDSRGLIVVSQTRVQPKKREITSVVKRNAYYSQLELQNGNVLTNEGDIIGDLPGLSSQLPVPGAFSFNTTITSDSLFWYSLVDSALQRTALYNYYLKTGETRKFEKINLGDHVIESGGYLYAINFKGIGRIEKDSIRYLYQYSGWSFREGLFATLEYRPGQLLIASCEGLLRYDIGQNKLDTVFYKKNSCIRSIWKYGEYLFFGSYGDGFYVMKDGKIKQMPLDKNKFLLYAHCFVADAAGYCWISTNRGLFKASLSDLITAYEKDIPQIYYHYLGKNDGMDITEMNGGCTPCALVLKSKTISFPTMDGLLWVDPIRATILLPEGNIYIDEFRAGNEKFNIDSLSTKQFSPRQNNITVKLGYASWCNKENIYLEYRLNNSGWVPVDVNNGALITLSNLPAGKYELEFRKLNGFGVANYSYKEIKFSIKTPWYQRWWFYALAALLLWAAIVLYLRLKTRQYQVRQRNLEKQVADKTKELKEQNEILEKNNTIKSRLISIISHDIITPLKFVTVAGKNLIEKRKMMPEELQQETILEMTNTTQELQFLSTNILNWIKYQNENRLPARETFNLREMVSQVIGLLSSLARQKKLVLENQVDNEMEVQQFYEPLKILVYNLLTNAIHFSEKGTIVVSAEHDKESFQISVKDEGVGMSPAQVQRIMADQVVITAANVDNKRGHGLGFLIIKDLLKTIGASVIIESKKGIGSKITMAFPLKG